MPRPTPQIPPSPGEIIQLARENGLTDTDIVRELTRGRIFRDAQQIARDYAPVIGVTVKEFMDLRKNEAD